jgi:hypothetical protein
MAKTATNSDEVEAEAQNKAKAEDNELSPR